MTKLKKYWPLPLILAAFFAGQFSGGKPDKELKEKYEQERKLIFQALTLKQVEIARLNDVSKAQEQKIAKLETEVKKGDQKVKAIEARNKRKIEKVSRYTPVQRDSFFYARYPGQDTIVNIDSRKVIADLVHGEGQDSLNAALKEQVVTLKSVVAEQKDQLKTEQAKTETQEGIASDFERAYVSEREEKEYYIKRERKQRRQKGIIIVVVAAKILYDVIKGITE